ncbi:MAG: Rrf2 family transcriptional regulator [Candidatus Cloacimonetes bacterium]|nr:Rrf2 family transcriptional regulator [Candidatus Cloacimonadota bacterium]
MRLSRKSEYAILALVSLAKFQDEKLLTIQDLADLNQIPRKFLEQILIILKRQNLVRSIRGPHGGYKLAKAASEISLAEVIRLIDGPLAPVDSVSVHFFDHSPIEKNAKVSIVLKEIRDYISEKLEHLFLSDLI